MRMIQRIFVTLLVSMTALIAAEQKVVFDLTTGDVPTIQKHLIKNIEGLAGYYKANDIDYTIAVVISGNAYKYFVQDLANSPFKGDLKVVQAQKKLGPDLEKLHRVYGVEFDMCKTGMKARKIDKKVLYSYVKAEMSKSLYLVKWQNEGHAYLPVH
jgi:uncharacterized protein